MTTYVLLALTDDGRVTAEMHCSECLAGIYPHESDCTYKDSVEPARKGNDRGKFVTFEIAGYSIDVVRLPEVKL